MNTRDITPAQLALLSDAAKHEHLQALAAQPDTVTGHYIMDDGCYGGSYTFPNNKDKFDIHWPPNVVPVAPPVARSGQVAKWNGSAWVLAEDTRFNGDNSTTPNPLYEQARQTRSEEERLRFLPAPAGKPQRNENGDFPITVLNADKTAWVWVYPEPEQVPTP